MTRKRLYFGAATILFLFSSLSLQAKPTGDQVSEATCDFNLPQVQKYVAQGWGINDPLSSDSGATALTLASYCYGGSAEIAAWLIQRGADVNKHDRNNYSNL